MAQLTFTEAGDAPRAGITVEGDLFHAVSAEGERRSMKIADLLDAARPSRVSTCGTVLPDGVKTVEPVSKGAIYVHQSPPRVYRFKWIADGSPAPFGPETRYREIRVALPYLVVLAVFEESRAGLLRLGNASEAFFATQPLDVAGAETTLSYPALLNCSKFPEGAEEKPLSWICVQHLEAQARGDGDRSTSVQRGLQALLQHLLESGFNHSSEHHEVSSWYSETVNANVDPRLATIESWERASAEDPLFVLDVPWLPTGHTLGGVIARIRGQRGRKRGVGSARDLERIVFQNTHSAVRTGRKR